jgi:hypothetical protein
MIKLSNLAMACANNEPNSTQWQHDPRNKGMKIKRRPEGAADYCPVRVAMADLTPDC